MRRNIAHHANQALLVVAVVVLGTGCAAVQTELKDADAYNDRGITYARKGQFDQALADYTKALEINPRFTPAYVNRAVTYYKKREFDQAWADVHKAQGLGFQIDPKFLKDLSEASGHAGN